MTRLIHTVTLIITLGFTSSVALALPNKDAGLGINLTGLSYWSSQWTLLDVMKQASNGSGQLWATTHAHDYTFNTGDQALLDLDANGWPRSLPNGEEAPFHYLTTVIFQDNPHYPTGDYVVLYEGQGELTYLGPELIDSAPGRDVVRLSEGRFFHLQIRSTDPQNSGDYLRNIRIIVPGGSCSAALDDFAKSAQACEQPADYVSFEHTYEQRIFHPLFIADIAPFRTLRFMQFMNTINHPGGLWSSRPQRPHASWALDKGAPLEVAMELANRTYAEPWLNMPIRANEDYIRDYARQIKSTLSEQLSFYIEFGNEIWNTAWPYNLDGEYLSEQARLYWPATTADDFTLRLNYYAMQSARMCTLIKQEFAEQQHRVNCVFGGQGDVTWVNEQILECPLFATTNEGFACHQHADYFAVGSYFAGYFADQRYLDILHTWAQAPQGLDNLFEEFYRGLLWSLTYDPQEPDWWQAPEHGALAAAHQSVMNSVNQLRPYQIPVVAYEGGQHLTFAGNMQGPRDLIQQQLFLTANRDPRMGNAFTTHLDNWRHSGAELFVLFESIGKWDRWGAFPLKEYQTQPRHQAVKYDAVRTYMEQYACWWAGCERTIDATLPTTPEDPDDPQEPDSPQPPQTFTLSTSALIDTMGVALSWPVSETGIGQYTVSRDGETVGQTTTSSYQDHWLNLRQPYVYQVQLRDSNGEVIAISESVTTYAGDSEAPSIPTDLELTSDGQWGYRLSWTPSTDNVAVTQYKVYRNGEPYSLSATSEFHDPWPPSAQVEYQIQAMDGAGNLSALSVAVSPPQN